MITTMIIMAATSRSHRDRIGGSYINNPDPEFNAKHLFIIVSVLLGSLALFIGSSLLAVWLLR